MKRLVGLGLGLLIVFAATDTRAEEEILNPFTASFCTGSKPKAYECRQAQAGETWHSLFPDAVRRFIAYNLNRQNEVLKEGQWVIVPPRGTDYLELAPLPQKGYERFAKVLVFSPELLAWGLYIDGTLQTWGAAVGGDNYCADIGRSCRTVVGTFRIISVDGPDRRSTRYPLGCSGEECAPMPYFMLFHEAGYGFHEGPMNGHNGTHGCVRVLGKFAKWLNTEHGTSGLPVVVEPYS